MLHSQPRDGADCWIKYDLTRTKTAGYDLFPNVLPVYNVAKWLELLKEIAPSVTRAAVSRDPTIAAGMGQFAAIQAVGPIGMELSVIDLHDAGAIERDIAEFARGSNGGLVVTAGPFGRYKSSTRG
jgi:hypothetical protein